MLGFMSGWNHPGANRMGEEWVPEELHSTESPERMSVKSCAGSFRFHV